MIKTVFPGLSALVIDQVLDLGNLVRVMARTPPGGAACPECGQLSERVHAYHQRQLADLPVGGRAVIAQVRVRRLVCVTATCPRRTLREQVPDVTKRWARRTRQLTALVADLAVVTTGRAGARCWPGSAPASRGARCCGY
ncbi:ISL3 family transposase [Actinoplanes subtropicus]|uniref:ISL3 family transposase n=1 Tax=Actinoplanes subtropicus TaxID=543632 RepID=UPI0004C33368|nr:ISL3 family transposase [Actinoplanes subtropicus]